MGFLDSIENMGVAQRQGDPGTSGGVSGAVLQALEEHPGGLSGVMDAFRNNGMTDHIENWSTGQQPTATPEQIQQGLGGTGLIENVATKAGVSPEIAKVALATVLPMVIAHFTNGGSKPHLKPGMAEWHPRS